MNPSKRLPESDLHEISSAFQGSSGIFKDKRILILGGTGFFGTWLIQALESLCKVNQLNLKIVAPSRKSTHITPNGTELTQFIHFDFKSTKIPKIFSEVDFVIHALSPTVEEDYSNILSFTELLLASFKTSNKAPNFVHLSSGAVYSSEELSRGNTSEEAHKAKPGLGFYTDLKLELEELVEIFTSKGKIYGCNPRLFAFAGPLLPLDAHFAVGNFVNDALQGKPIEVRGCPETIRSYLYPSDAIIWILNCLMNPMLGNINIGSDIPISMIELANTVADIFEAKEISFSKSPSPKSIYFPSTKKSLYNFNISQTISLRMGLRRWKSWLDV